MTANPPAASAGNIKVAATSGIKRAWIEGRIIRADGTVEDLGVLCSTGELLPVADQPARD